MGAIVSATCSQAQLTLGQVTTQQYAIPPVQITINSPGTGHTGSQDCCIPIAQIPQVVGSIVAMAKNLGGHKEEETPPAGDRRGPDSPDSPGNGEPAHHTNGGKERGPEPLEPANHADKEEQHPDEHSGQAGNGTPQQGNQEGNGDEQQQGNPGPNETQTTSDGQKQISQATQQNGETGKTPPGVVKGATQEQAGADAAAGKGSAGSKKAPVSPTPGHAEGVQAGKKKEIQSKVMEEAAVPLRVAQNRAMEAAVAASPSIPQDAQDLAKKAKSALGSAAAKVTGATKNKAGAAVPPPAAKKT